jgi:hypothetical protein
MLKQLLIMTVITTALPANAQVIFSGRDGQPIGIISKDQFKRDSICNESGAGSEYANYSIFNRFGVNGSDSSRYGSYNPDAQYPPYFIYKGKVFYVTAKRTNYRYIIHPDRLKDLCY